MEKIGQAVSRHGQPSLEATEELTQAILADATIAAFISQHGMTQAMIERSLPKFNQFRNERHKFQTQDPAYIAKGYQPILVMNEGYADVAYQETQELIEAKEEQAIGRRIRLVSLPKSYRKLTFEDVALDDTRRLEAFGDLVDFVTQFPQKGQKGLYLYGDMGIGKSYMLAALAHELASKKGVSTTMLHFPTFAIDARNAIKESMVKPLIDDVKDAPVLIFDDIGAEQFSSWVRDEVLQVILQHRMLEELPTFFTSNYSMDNLEEKYADGKKGDESWQAKRVMERIRYLAKPLHLQGENRR